MTDNRMHFINSVTESLAGRLSNLQLEMVADELTKALWDYELVEAKNELIVYEGVNENIVKRYCACLMIEGKSEKTINAYRYTIKSMFDCVQKDYTDIGVYDIRMFLAMEKQRGISNRSLENTRANLSAFFQWMTREEIILKNPCMGIKPIKYTKKVKLPFSSVEIDMLRSACNTNKQRAMVEILLSTGVRVSEFVNIKITDVDFNNLSIHITKGKGDKERTVYMSELAKSHLQKYLLESEHNNGFLFLDRFHHQYKPDNIRKLLNCIADRAKVDNVHPHRFRRTFATTLANRGMDIQEIKVLMGHSDINTTLEYVYTSDNKVQNSYKRYIA